MDRTTSSQIINVKFAVISALILSIFLFLIWLVYKDSSHNLRDILKTIIKKQELLANIRINLLASVNVEKSAVIADTDELSLEFAKKAIQLDDTIDKELSELRLLMKDDSSDTELRLIKEFDICWQQFRKIDKVLLEFAVENTNIKASSLSLTKARKSLDRFEENIIDIINRNATSANGGNIVRLACDAITAALKIQYLHMQHISISEDTAMNDIESEIAGFDKVVNDSLTQLQTFVDADSKIALRDASSAYAAFMTVNSEILKLSRQNTNIRSFELSLGRKRKITAECDEILGNLQDAVRSRTFDATK